MMCAPVRVDSARPRPESRSSIPQLDFRTSDRRACVGWIANDTSSFLFRLLRVFVYYLPAQFTYILLDGGAFFVNFSNYFRRFFFPSSFNAVPISRREGDRHKFESGF